MSTASIAPLDRAAINRAAINKANSLHAGPRTEAGKQRSSPSRTTAAVASAVR